MVAEDYDVIVWLVLEERKEKETRVPASGSRKSLW